MNSAANQNEVEGSLKKEIINLWNTNMQSKTIFRFEIVTKSREKLHKKKNRSNNFSSSFIQVNCIDILHLYSCSLQTLHICYLMIISLQNSTKFKENEDIKIKQHLNILNFQKSCSTKISHK